MFDKNIKICYNHSIKSTNEKESFMAKKNQTYDEILEYIARFTKNNGFPPSVREIQANFHFRSTSTVSYYLRKLEESGQLINRGRKNRALSVSESFYVDNPVYKPKFLNSNFAVVPLLGNVTAGQRILAEENHEDEYYIPTNLFHGDNLFMLTVQGESMIEAGIFSDDKIIVRQQNYAEDGEIVVALIENSATVKTYYKDKDKIRLQPANSTMSAMYFDNLTILGKVIGLIRKF